VNPGILNLSSYEKVTLITASGMETAPIIEVKRIRFLMAP